MTQEQKEPLTYEIDIDSVIESNKTRFETNKELYAKYNFKPGMKIRFFDERNSYTIRACNERYLVCTKPYNFKKNTVIYTMVDLWEGIRGRDGYSIGPYDYYNQEDCESYLQELINGKIHISSRHWEPLSIYKVK